MADETLMRDVRLVVRDVRAGQVVFVVGSAAAGDVSRAAVAATLASRFDYPEGSPVELERVAQWVAVVQGRAAAQRELHELVAEKNAVSPVERFLATLPSLAGGVADPLHQIIVTTSYGLGVERGLREAGLPFDLLLLASEQEGRPQFAHVAEDGGVNVISNPNRYDGLDPAVRTIVVKPRVRFDPREKDETGYVVTEDDVAALSSIDLTPLLPVGLRAPLAERMIVFLGLSIGNRVERLVVRRLFGRTRLRGLAVGAEIDRIDELHWDALDVKVVHAPPEEYVALLADAFGESAFAR